MNMTTNDKNFIMYSNGLKQLELHEASFDFYKIFVRKFVKNWSTPGFLQYVCRSRKSYFMKILEMRNLMILSL